MATANAYAGRLVGNEFVLPSRKEKQFTNETPQPQLTTSIGAIQTVTPTIWAPSLPQAKSNSRFSILRTVLLVTALLCSFSLAYITYINLSHGTLLATADSTVAKLDQRISANLHHTPALISLPSYSLVVKTKNLSSDINNVEAQPISVHLSFAVVAVSPNQIAQWIKTTAGPVTGSTLISVNTNTLSGYLNSLARQYDRSPVNQVITTSSGGMTSSIVTQGTDGIVYGGVAVAVKEIASKLFTASGVNVVLPSSSVPFSNVVSR